MDGLVVRGISAANFDSKLDRPAARDVYERWRAGPLRLLYVAPERFKAEHFWSPLRTIPIERPAH